MDSEFDEKAPGDLGPRRQVSANKDLRSKLSSEKHDDTRIDLFKKAASTATCAFWVFGVLLFIIVISYIVLIFRNHSAIPANFWHIPTLVGLITMSILISLLKFTSNFGSFLQNNIDEDKSSPTADYSSIKKEQKAFEPDDFWVVKVVKELKQYIVDYFK